MKNNRRLSLLLILSIFIQVLIPVKLAFAQEEDFTEVEELDNIEIKSEENLEEEKGIRNENSRIKEVIEDKENEEIIESEEKQDGNEEEISEENIKEDDSKKKGFIIKLDKLSHSDGKDINDGNPLDMEEDFFIHYTWSLDNDHNYKENDQVSFELPKGIKITKEEIGDLKDRNGNIFTKYRVGTDGRVVFTFTKIIEELSNINGTLYIKSYLDEENVEIEDGNLIIRPHEEGGKLEVPIKEGQIKGKISKSGRAVPSYNPKEIEWTIEVDTENTRHSRGKIIDRLPKGLKYKEGSIRGANEPKIIGQDLEINLGSFKGKKTISIITSIEDDYWKDLSFNNKVSYKSDRTEEIEASSTVSFNRGKALNKKAGIYNPQEKTIDWEIQLNYDGKIVGKTSLIDEWESGIMELLEGSIEIYEMEIDSNGIEKQGKKVKIGELVKNNDSGFTINFGKIDRAYKIKYKTKLKNRPLDGKLISNSIKWNGSSGGSSVFIGEFVLNKFHGTPDYKDKTVPWTVRINEDRQEMNNVIISDEFTSKGLSLIEDSLKVVVGSQILEKGKDYKLDLRDDKFILEFLGDYKKIREIIHLEYRTKFDYSKIEKGNLFINELNVQWKDENGKDQSKELTRPFKPDDFTVKDGNKFGYYDARDKTITWNIGVNYQQNDYKNLIVRDEILGNQKLLLDSIKVFEGDIQGINSIQKGQEMNKWTSKSNPNFIDIDLGKTNKSYVIEYKTTLDGFEIIDKNYHNEAKVFDGDKEKKTDLKADIGISNGGEYGSKTVEQDGDKLNWTVIVNPQQASIVNAKLVDQLEDQEFLPDTIKIYKTIVDNYGNISKGERVEVESIKFNKEFTEMTLDLGDIDRAYVVEYSTIYFKEVGGIVKNEYEIVGSNLTSQGEHGGSLSHVIKQGSGGSASGVAGALRVEKIDAIDGRKLKGAEFEVRDIKTGKKLKSGSSNDHGIIDFGKLKFGRYHLVEIKAPAGYKLDKKPLEIKVDKEYKGDESSLTIKKVENNKVNRRVRIIKYGEDGENRLEDGAFTIRNLKGDIIRDNLRTNKNGEILVENLEVGIYSLEETEAPKGYEKLPGKIYFEIKEDQIETLELKVFNLKKKGSVQLLKRDADTKLPLEGVEFELWKIRFEDSGKSEKIEKVGSYISNETGYIGIDTSKLEDGDYELFESKPLEGYRPYRGAPLGFKVGPGLAKDFSFIVENKKDDSNQKIIKVDKDNRNKRLEGARFELYNEKGQLITNGNQSYFESDKNGEIVFKDLKDGKYKFKEVKAPEGYRLNGNELSFTVGDGDIEPIIVENELILVDLKVKKVNKLNNAILTGASFKLSRLVDGGKEVLFNELDVNYEGELIVENVPEGKYILEEVKAPEGYQKLPEAIEITIDEKNKKTIEILVPNAPLGHAQVMKFIEGSRTPISGVSFKLEKQNKNGGWDFVEEITTGIRGYATSQRLNIGRYRYTETYAPEGVMIDSNPVEFTVDIDNFTQEDLSFVFYNKYETALKLIKKGEEGEALQGAEFNLYKGDELIEEALLTDKKGEINVKVKEEGQYYFQESKAPKGYKLDRSKQNIWVEAGKVSTIEVINKKDLIEPPITEPENPIEPPVEPPITEPENPIEPPVEPPITEPENPIEPPVEPPITEPENPIEPPVEPPITEPENPIEPPVEPPITEPENPIEPPVEPPITEPEKPIEPPVDPAPTEPEIPLGSLTEIESSRLPSTGQGNLYVYYISGSFLILIAFILKIRDKKINL